MEQRGATEGTARRTAAEADVLVVTVLQRHADTLLRLARRGSLCEDDAADAYQRGVEIFLVNARRLEASSAHSWLFRVVVNEAAAVRKQRLRLVGAPVGMPVDEEARHLPSPEEQVLRREALAHTGEALHALKADELHALMLRADGHSYAEIAAVSGWTFTKVNRALTEGRRRLQARRAAIDAGEECARWRPLFGALLAGSASARDVTGARRHLRGCPACRASVRRLHAEGTAGAPGATRAVGADAAAAA